MFCEFNFPDGVTLNSFSFSKLCRVERKIDGHLLHAIVLYVLVVAHIFATHCMYFCVSSQNRVGLMCRVPEYHMLL